MINLNKEVWRYIYLCELRVSFIFYIVFMIFLSLLELMSIGVIFPILTALVDDGSITKSYDYGFLNWIMSLDKKTILTSAIVLYVLRSIIVFFGTWYQAKFSEELVLKLSNKVFGIYLKADVETVQRENTTDLIRKVTGTVNQVVNSHILQVVIISFELFTLILIGAAIFSVMSFQLFIAISLVFLILFMFSKIISNHLSRIGNTKRIYETKKMEHIHVLVGMVRELKNFSLSSFLQGDYYSACRISAKASVSLRTLSSIPRNLMELVIFVGSLTYLLILITDPNSFIEQVPIIGTLMFALLKLVPSVNKINVGWQMLKFSSSFLEELNNDLFNKKYPDVKLDYKNYSAEMEFTSLTIVGLEVKKGTAVFGPWDAHVKKGEWLAIKGETGCGKSTLMDAILGFQKIDKGHILLNGKNIVQQYSPFYNMASYVPQKVYLLNNSLKENIVLYGNSGKATTDYEYNRILKICNLSELATRSDLLKSSSLDNAGLSGGQRQRVGIARALIRVPEILFLDESTAGLDIVIQDLILSNIKENYPQITVIMITHSEHVDRFFDRKITLQ